MANTSEEIDYVKTCIDFFISCHNLHILNFHELSRIFSKLIRCINTPLEILAYFKIREFSIEETTPTILQLLTFLVSDENSLIHPLIKYHEAFMILEKSIGMWFIRIDQDELTEITSKMLNGLLEAFPNRLPLGEKQGISSSLSFLIAIIFGPLTGAFLSIKGAMPEGLYEKATLHLQNAQKTIKALDDEKDPIIQSLRCTIHEHIAKFLESVKQMIQKFPSHEMSPKLAVEIFPVQKLLKLL